VTLTLANNANLQLAEGVNAALTLAAEDNVTNTSTSYLKGTLNLELAKNTATANAITVTNSSAGNDGFDTVNLSVTADSTGTTNSGVKLVAGSAAVVATGAKKLILTGDSTAKSLDASAMTGAVTVTFDGTSDIATVKTGSANDTVTLSTTKVSVDTGAGNDSFTLGGNLATDTSVAAGDGTDTLTLSAASQIQAASVTGIDIYNLAGNALQANASTFSGSAAVVQSSGAAAITLKNIGSSVDLSNVTFEHASNGTFSVDFSTDLASTLGTSSNFTATGSSHADTITTGNGVNTVNGGAGGDSITGGTSIDTIDGGAGDDVIVGNDGADALTAGEGADVITGGAGNDTIVLTEATAAVDKLVFSAVASNGKDTVTGFGAADTLNVAALGDGAIATVAAAISTAAAQRTMTDNQAYVVTTDGTAASITTSGVKTVTDWTDATTVAAYLNEGFAAASAAATEANVFVINAKGTSMTYVWSYDNADAATDIDTAEITLVAVIDNGGTGLAAANVLFA
jgi:Ca2+-binding RTX toxin-like protein